MKSFWFHNMRKHSITTEPESCIAFGQQERISEEQSGGHIKTEFPAFNKYLYSSSELKVSDIVTCCLPQTHSFFLMQLPQC